MQVYFTRKLTKFIIHKIQNYLIVVDVVPFPLRFREANFCNLPEYRLFFDECDFTGKTKKKKK